MTIMTQQTYINNYKVALLASWEEEMNSSYEAVLFDIVFNLPQKGELPYEIY